MNDPAACASWLQCLIRQCLLIFFSIYFIREHGKLQLCGTRDYSTYTLCAQLNEIDIPLESRLLQLLSLLISACVENYKNIHSRGLSISMSEGHFGLVRVWHVLID